MILNEDQIKSIILNNPNAELVNTGQVYSKLLRMYFYGEKLSENLPVIAEYEKPTLRELRVKYTKSTKDLFARVTRPIDKVFSSKGGSIYYNLSEAQDKKARQLTTDVRSGYSAKAWIENFWKPHFLDDPNGFIFMEIADRQTALQLKKKGKSFVYPTYKSISTVYDYLPNGASLEYVVFKLDAKEKIAAGLKVEDQVYRVVDDAADYYVKREAADTVTIISELTLLNYFGQVPAMLNSDIPNPTRDGNMLSPMDQVLELAHQFLLKGSIKVTHDFLHGFPKYWEYADDCNTCGGTRLVGAETCKDCKGTGKKLMTKVSDAKLLSHPQTKEDPVITPNVAGYVEPSKIYWEIATTDLQMLEDLINFTLWGANPMPRTQGMKTDQQAGQKTATEIMTDIKPQSDRLHPISEAAEKRDKFIRDAVIKTQVNPFYQGASVKYGKRYMLESHDVLFERYIDAKTKGAAESVLNDMLVEYYETKYDSDPVKLAIQIKLMKVEPFVHLTATQLKALSPAEEDYKAKLYFGEWLATLNDAMILSFSEEELKTQLAENVKTKKLPEPETQKQAA